MIDGSFLYRHVIKELSEECRRIAHDLPAFGSDQIMRLRIARDYKILWGYYQTFLWRSSALGVNLRMSIPKIKSANALDHRTLFIIFTNGEKKVYDVGKLLDNDMFAPLKNP